MARVWLTLVVLLGAVFVSSGARAQSVCDSQADCDADGVPNESDDCPAPMPGVSPDGSIRHGFRDPACYQRVFNSVSQLLPCDIVAVRPYDEDVPPGLSGGTAIHRRGLTWVGVLRSSVQTSSPRLQQLMSQMASPSAVTASFRDPAPDAEPAPNALFACMGSVELLPASVPNPGGLGPFKLLAGVLGYRLTTAYVRAVVDAAHSADALGYPKSDPKRFSDGLGLLTDVCTTSTATGTCYARGLFGTNGAWLDDRADYGNDLALLSTPDDDALPYGLTKIYDAQCLAEKLQKIVELSLKAAMKTIPVNPGPGPDPTWWKELATPFGPTPVQFQGPAYGAASGAKPLAAGGDEYQGSGAIAFVDHQSLVINVGADCGVPTDVPNFAFGLPKIPGYPNLDPTPLGVSKQPLKKKLGGYSEFVAPAGMHDPRAMVTGVGEFLATHVHTKTFAYDGQLSWSMLVPRPDRLPPFRSARSDAALLVSQDAPLPPYAVVEAGSALWGILGALNWQDVHPFAAPWTHDAGGQRTLGIYNLGKKLDQQSFDYAAGKWTTTTEQSAGQPDYAEVTAPLTWFSGDGKDLSNARVTVHLAPDKWNPAGDRWLTNAATKRCENLSHKLGSFPLNPGYAIEESWCRDPTLLDIPELKDFEKRVGSCDVDHYDPGEGEKHWLPLRSRAPFAALWGHLQAGGDKPKAKFPSGDLLRAGVARTNILHEGLDINWVFEKKYLERTDVMGNIPSKVCFSQLDALGAKVQTALSCSDSAYSVCGSLADNTCCNPLERYWEEYKSEIEDACSCASPPSCSWYDVICHTEAVGSIFSCAVNELLVCAPTIVVGGIKFLAKTVVAYASTACVLLTGKASCSDAGFSTCSANVSNAGEIENELEYNIAYGARVNKTGWGPGFEYLEDCTPSDLPCECTWGTPVQQAFASPIYTKAGKYRPGNFLYGSKGLLVGLDDDARLVGVSAKAVAQPDNPLFWTEPFTVAPGLFHEARAVWGKVARKAGTSSGALDSVSVLTPELTKIGQTSLPTDSADYAFRLEMLGDLIVDCGHVPFRSEIHPPVAAALHLAGTKVTRYSLFGWHRKTLDRDPVVIDLWPGAPRPSNTAKLTTKVVFDAGFGSGAGTWSCTPSPVDQPSRVRCELVAGPTANATSGCSENPRMRPACATDVAGGIVELAWQ